MGVVVQKKSVKASVVRCERWGSGGDGKGEDEGRIRVASSSERRRVEIHRRSSQECRANPDLYLGARQDETRRSTRPAHRLLAGLPLLLLAFCPPCLFNPLRSPRMGMPFDILHSSRRDIRSPEVEIFLGVDSMSVKGGS